MLILSLGNSFGFKGLLRCMKLSKCVIAVFTGVLQGLRSKIGLMQVGPWAPTEIGSSTASHFCCTTSATAVGKSTVHMSKVRERFHLGEWQELKNVFSLITPSSNQQQLRMKHFLKVFTVEFLGYLQNCVLINYWIQQSTQTAVQQAAVISTLLFRSHSWTL